MWTKGKINGYAYAVKHYEETSIYGIEEGRISKLEIRKDGRIVANYDREWDIEPKGADVKAVYNKLIKKYN
jgi:hypothetical protein